MQQKKKKTNINDSFISLYYFYYSRSKMKNIRIEGEKKKYTLYAVENVKIAYTGFYTLTVRYEKLIGSLEAQ